MRGVALGVVAIVTLSSLAAVADDRPDANQALQSFEKTVGELNPVYIETQEKQWIRRNAQDAPGRDGKSQENPEVLESTRQTTVAHRGVRWRIAWAGASSGLITGIDYILDEFLNESQALHIQWVKRQGDESGQLAHVALLLLKDSRRAEPSTYLNNSGPLFGYLEGDDGQPVWKLMSEADTLELLPEVETIDGHKTYVLKSRGRFGNHALWLDPEFGNLPRRIVVSKESGHQFDSVQLGVEQSPSARIPVGARVPPRARPAPNFTLEQTLDRYDNLKLEKKQGHVVMTAYDRLLAKTVKYTDRTEKTEHRTEYRAQKADFEPDTWPENAFRPAIDIPDGTAVQIHGRSERHVWSKGTIE